MAQKKISAVAAGRNLILTGFMATGKTAVGQILARRLGRRFVDTDSLVEEIVGMSVSQVFELSGEAWFREREREAVASLADFPPNCLVVSTGGGVVLCEENMQSLESHGIIILLTASVNAILRRTGGDRTRPLLRDFASPREGVLSLLKKREPYYNRHHFYVDTTGKTPARAAAEIINMVRGAPSP